MQTLLAAGETSPNDWVTHPTNRKQIYVDIETGLSLKETPIYICSIVGDTNHWSTTGGSSIYTPSPTGFRVNIRFGAIPTPQGPVFPDLDAAYARERNWRISWAAFERK